MGKDIEDKVAEIVNDIKDSDAADNIRAIKKEVKKQAKKQRRKKRTGGLLVMSVIIIIVLLLLSGFGKGLGLGGSGLLGKLGGTGDGDGKGNNSDKTVSRVSETTNTMNPTQTGGPESTSGAGADENKIISIIVSGNEITYAGEKLASVDELEKKLDAIQNKENKPTVDLVDDNAIKSLFEEVENLINSKDIFYDPKNEDESEASSEPASTEEPTKAQEETKKAE